MALESVGSAIASSIFEALFDKLTSAETIDYFRKKCNDENLHSRLRTTLFSINAVADDAEQKQVKKWLLEVQDVLDAQDLVEEIQVQVFKSNQDADESTGTKKTDTCIGYYCENFSPNNNYRPNLFKKK